MVGRFIGRGINAARRGVDADFDERLGVSISQVEQLREHGKLPAVNVGVGENRGIYRFDRQIVERFWNGEQFDQPKPKRPKPRPIRRFQAVPNDCD